MSTIDDAVATMRKNLAERTGKSFTAWVNIARSLGTGKHSDIVAYLKSEGPMGHGYANAVALEARKSAVIVAEDPVDIIFAGDKASLRPTYDAIAAVVSAFGKDVLLPQHIVHVRFIAVAVVIASSPLAVDR